MNQIIFGCAYYDEYMPYERLLKDIEMMKKAGINTVRIAESTWSTEEPQEGVYDFSHVVKVMDAMEEAGINVIIGTPTYAIPYWLAEKYPDVMADTHRGVNRYGSRQLMNIHNVHYRKAAEGIIRKLAEITADRKCVIGYQIDNETKHYDACNEDIQKAFVEDLKKQFYGDLDALNRAYGLAYWSNLIPSWDCFPDVRGTINGSLRCAFEKFQRKIVTEFLQWEADIIREYKRDDQFITHNFDYEWRGYSYGVQPMVNHFEAAKCLDITGCDIYHPTQSHLTGAEIAFGGDMARSLKQDNYLVLETQAQGFPNWHPYPGQLRLQFYSHLASGADGVNYWHWHSIHNSAETYWMGILGHDFEENDVYKEVCVIGNELKGIGQHLLHLKKHNSVAMLVSNEALTALNAFPMDMDATFSSRTFYNDIVRWMYDALYKMNVECDFITPQNMHLDQYKMVVVPALYACDDACLHELKDYVKEGGVVISTFKTAYADENIKVYADRKPHILHEAFGMHYHGFTFPENVNLTIPCQAETFMEFLETDGCETIASYDHPAWKQYSAITKNQYGNGTAYYLGTKIHEEQLQEIYRMACKDAEVELSAYAFPLIQRKGINTFAKQITYLLNYSYEIQETTCKKDCYSILENREYHKGEQIAIKGYDLVILEER